MDCLLVEDEPQVATLLLGRLDRVGFRVDWVTSVSAAVGALLLRPYSVVLLDIVLKPGGGRPNQDGLDVAREMRRRGIDTPFVVMTAFPTFEHGLEIGELHPAAVLEKGADPRPIVEACQAAAAAAAAAALRTSADPIARAREDPSAIDLSRPDAADRCSAILFRAIGHRALTLFQSVALSRECEVLSRRAAVPDMLRLVDALNTPPLVGHPDVDRLLAVLASGPVASNAALSAAGGMSVRAIRELLKTHTGHGPTECRCVARGTRFVGRLVNTHDDIGHCADAAGYRYGRESVEECRRLFGRIPTEIRRLLKH